ncbi:hypothetical protein EEB14_08540 [Rhodococcus sp. WS4]|nr:hypothetical protein EEB14_08540 [Rhodococcus sp. WS4]
MPSPGPVPRSTPDSGRRTSPPRRIACEIVASTRCPSSCRIVSVRSSILPLRQSISPLRPTQGFIRIGASRLSDHLPRGALGAHRHPVRVRPPLSSTAISGSPMPSCTSGAADWPAPCPSWPPARRLPCWHRNPLGLDAHFAVPWSGSPAVREIRVVAADGSDVLPDGDSVGEVWLRGNTLMLGYFQDDATTTSAISGDWFRTGHIAVLHPDGQLELRDRKKDVIISGGENITSIEVEQAIASHPAVLEVAVVGVRDQRWGEVPVAHVQLRDNQVATEQDIIEHARKMLARSKTPHRVIFGPLPRTATGKIQKFALREAHRSQTVAPGR